MATLNKDLKAILDRYGINYQDKSMLWDCHGTLVLYHKAYEKIAAKEGITFDPPQVYESNGKEKIVSMLVVGHFKDRTEWSIGEAAPNNCKNSYPYAMAEKRGKDRVIAKLVGLSEYVYSEDEADDFKAAKPNPIAPLDNNEKREFSFTKEDLDKLEANIRECDTQEKYEKLRKIANDEKKNMRPHHISILRKALAEKSTELTERELNGQFENHTGAYQ